MGEVVGVAMYPLKGAQPATIDGRAPDALETHVSGFMMGGFADREFFVASVGANDELAILTPRGWANDMGPRVAHEEDSLLNAIRTDITTDDQVLHLTYGGSGLHLGADIKHNVEPDDPRLKPVKLHGGTVMGLDLGDISADFISEIVGRDARLMLAPSTAQRLLRGGVLSNALAADGYPYLITVKGSLDWLNGRESTDTQMDQYRPNIVLDLGPVEPDANGLLPEDKAGYMQIGDQMFDVASASARCIVTNIINGQRVGRGLRTLRSRFGVKLDDEGEPRADSEGNFFGVNANLLPRIGGSAMVGVRNRAGITVPREFPLVRLRRVSS